MSEPGPGVASTLPGGLVLRPIRDAEIDQAADLLTARGEAADAEDLRLVLDDPDAGPAGTAVVVDRDRVVATATLLDEQVLLAGHVIAAGQVELVATDRAYEGRGLARALMDWCHERSASQGHLAQVMIGIPNFYRRFGYSYAIPMPRVHTLGHAPEPAVGTTVRRARTSDIPATEGLHDAEQAAYDLVMPHSTACWRWVTARSGSEQWVAERAGEMVAVGRLLPEERVVGELAATDPAGALALVSHASGCGDRDTSLSVQVRDRGVAAEALRPHLDAGGRPDWYYARVPDPGALLVHLGPLLAARMAGAGIEPGNPLRDDDPDGPGSPDQPPAGCRRVLLSTYAQHLVLDVGAGDARLVRRGGPLQSPVSGGGSGLAAESVPGLIFGPYGASGLDEREPDVLLGRHPEVMTALFPPVAADLLTFYLPV